MYLPISAPLTADRWVFPDRSVVNTRRSISRVLLDDVISLTSSLESTRGVHCSRSDMP